MSCQLTLDKFYKSFSRISRTLKFEMDEPEIQKRHNNSPTVTSPSKTPKLKQEDSAIVNLISDDEDEFDSLIEENKHVLDEILSDSSSSTLIYTPPETFQTSPKSPTSPHSSKKYFSPTKKRNVKVRTPMKARKNLSKDLSVDNKNSEFDHACEGLDDKTIFLLKIIFDYINNDSLKPLLDQSSQKLLVECKSIVKPGLKMVCRLYWWKEGWYRVEKLKTLLFDKDPVDTRFDEIINCLLLKGLLVASNNIAEKQGLQFDDLIDMLKLNEVKEICKELKLKVTSKDDARRSLESFSKQSNISQYLGMNVSNNKNRVLKILHSKVGTCYKLSKEARRTLHELHILMYLGIDFNILREKKLELVLLNDKVKRETYPVDKNMVIDNASVVFRSRREFQSYLDASAIYEEFLDATNVAERCETVENTYKMYLNISKEDILSYKSLPAWLRKFTPVYLYLKILETGIVDLKKLSTEENNKSQLALDILSLLINQDAFRVHKKAEWYAEKALIYEKLLKNPDKAAETLLEGFKTDLPKEDLDCMRPRARKLINRQTNKLDDDISSALSVYVKDYESILEKNIKAKHVYKQPMESSGRGKQKFEVRMNQSRMVLDAEEFCKMHYIETGEYTHGEHLEGRIISTLFYLLFWDIIYANLRGIRGIFLTHYQMHPLDMFEGFYENRKCLIEDRLREIENSTAEELLERMKAVWDSRPEGELPGFRNVSWAAVCAVARGGGRGGRGGRGAAALCARLARQPRRTAGFPDLTLWNEDTHQIIFVEVKTDSDKPSMKQIQWMHYLQQHGINTEFCYVGVNTTRCRARNTDNC